MSKVNDHLKELLIDKLFDLTLNKVEAETDAERHAMDALIMKFLNQSSHIIYEEFYGATFKDIQKDVIA
jgi:hypothetical protein